MFVIKATLRDETRRISFDVNGFPNYSEIQDKVSCLWVANPSLLVATTSPTAHGEHCEIGDVNRIVTLPTVADALGDMDTRPPRTQPGASCTGHEGTS